MTPRERASLETQLLTLQQLKKTAAVKKQIHIIKMFIEHGDNYDPNTDWWPNKYPDM